MFRQNGPKKFKSRLINILYVEFFEGDMEFIPCLIYPVNVWWIKGEIIKNTSWRNTHKYNFFRPYSNILDPKNDTLDHNPMV